MKIIYFAVFFVTLNSCRPSCSDYPVEGKFRGQYVVEKDKSVHFKGQNFDISQNLDIIIPSKYYSLEYENDSTYNLECFCLYKGQ